ncbi:Translin-1 [Ceratocystis pirilliformis]|uniref:Translin-1 n=1 Tax=Ceratocystis pirilliformis TaxID=259994 RepID=A0ABR3Z0T4_9PEZI
MSSQTGLLASTIFDDLKARVETDSQTRDDIAQAVQKINASNAFSTGLLTRVHSTPRAKYPELLTQVEAGIKKDIVNIKELAALASEHPYYKFNFLWNRAIENVIFSILMAGFLGGVATETSAGELGRILTPEQVSEVLQVPYNVKNRDTFHITIEEYLLAVTRLTEELSRLVTNSVTLGDTALAVQAGQVVKDLFAGFQMLNLKNDIIRKRSDAVKYHVKKVEDVIYDLSLRGLLPRAGSGADAVVLDADQQ